MAENRITTENNPSLTSLVSGIVGDVQQLIRHEIQLARTEVRQEWDKTKTAAGSMAVGAGLLTVGGLLLCYFLVYLIHYFGVPLWACFLIVGGVLSFAGLLLVAAGYHKAGQVHVVPPQTAETLKENVQWMHNQT
jgi:hypothetical protein